MKRKSLSLKDLERDKKQVEAMLQRTQIQVYRLDGILGYLDDNIKALKQEDKKDVR